MKNVVFRIFDSITAFRGIRSHNPPENGVLHFQPALSLNIGDTELDLGISFDSISLKLSRTVVSVENWSCIIFGPIRPNEGEARGSANSKMFRK